MDRRGLIGLFECYGMVLILERKEEHKMRFRGNGTIIDFWDGKKGRTLGIYDRTIKQFRFRKHVSNTQLEDELIKLQNEHGD